MILLLISNDYVNPSIGSEGNCCIQSWTNFADQSWKIAPQIMENLDSKCLNIIKRCNGAILGELNIWYENMICVKYGHVSNWWMVTLLSLELVPIVPIVRLSAPSPTLLRNWRKLGFIWDSLTVGCTAQISQDPSHSCPDGLAAGHPKEWDEF